jgi:hypothetical protein
MYISMLGPPMIYIAHISSKSSVFETIRVNKSMNTCLILARIEYLRIFVLVLSANIREYSPSKYSCECEYWIAYVREYLYSRIYTCSKP